MYPIAHFINAALDTAPSRAHCATHGEHVPRTNILEGEHDYRILMDLPGVRNEDLEISLEGTLLSVKAERSLAVPEGYTGRRRELAANLTWQRSFDLGNTIDPDGITANLEHGILTLSLPKSSKVLPRRIQVQ